MRTMLILVLLCSLAQLAFSDPPSVPFVPEGCGKTYNCFAPGSCSSSPVQPIGTSNVMAVHAYGKIYEPCPALIKFHAYAENWVHVTIESPLQTTKSIEFIHKDGSSPINPKNEFSCKIDDVNNKLEFSYGPKRIVTKLFDLNLPIKCQFEVKLSKGKKLMDYVYGDVLQIKVDSTGTEDLPSESPIVDLKKFCDPSKLEIRNDVADSSEVYEKVQHSPEKFYCNYENIFTMKYRADSSAGYTDAALSCVPGTSGVSPYYTVGGTKLDPVDIKCIADAKYFCNADGVKEVEPKRLLRTKADKETAIASSLKCPADFPYLHVKGRPVFDHQIVCVNYGGTSQLWTVGVQTLTEKGPDIYCSDKLDCLKLHKISETAVDGGTLDADFLPKCHGNGVLQDANEQAIENAKITCDFTTGNYTYSVGGQSKIVDKDTKFICYHPLIRNEVQEQKDHNKLTVGTIAASAFGGLAAIGMVIGLFFYTRRKIRIRNAEIQKRIARATELDKKLFDQFGTSRDEKIEMKIKKEEGKLVKKRVGGGVGWNDMQMSYQYDALSSLSTGRTDGKYALPAEYKDSDTAPVGKAQTKSPLKETQKKLKDKKVNKNDAIVRVLRPFVPKRKTSESKKGAKKNSGKKANSKKNK